MHKKQVYNPFLPLNEYIPDGEPHVFGDRVYLFGSHDREGGYTFCMEDYVVYSAPVDDLSDWRYEGVTYKASQDPRYPNPQYMYAPDVVRGNDGRYYLYYCLGGDYGYGGYSGPISVAVCDTPAGKYEYLGVVKNTDGTPLMKYVCFDPAVINDNGVIRVYYGTQYGDEESSGLADVVEKYYASLSKEGGETDSNKASDTKGGVTGIDKTAGDKNTDDYNECDVRCDNYDGLNLTDDMEDVIRREMDMFGRTREEILSYPDSINGAIMVVLEDDMLTVKEEAKHIIPYKVRGTSFEEHPFFEGPSMRKVLDKYYFIYSSWLNHELCYAVSDYPDRDFIYGGTIVSNGDVGLNGRRSEDKLNMTGTTHGSICEINGEWYVFFHRLTHKSDYSRQACAEKISIEQDGSIKQVEITSCGLNDGALMALGRYPSVICCNLTNGHMPHGSNSVYTMSFPNVNNIGDDRFIAEIEDGTLIGYKYFDFNNVTCIGVIARFENNDNRVVFDGPVRLDDRCTEDEARLHENFDRESAEGDITDKNNTDGENQDSFGVETENDKYGGHEISTTDNSSQKLTADNILQDGGRCFFEVRIEADGECLGIIELNEKYPEGQSIGANINVDEYTDSFAWHTYTADIHIPDGVHALYLIYHGNKKLQLKEIVF